MYQQQPQEPQLGVMNQLKEQLEERTRILQMDIKTQQQELHDIKEKLQLANLQVTLLTASQTPGLKQSLNLSQGFPKLGPLFCFLP